LPARYRISREYRVLKIFDPYTIAILLTLKNGPMNLSEIYRRVSSIAEVSIVTLTRKIRLLNKHGLIYIAEKRKAPFSDEKRYKLSRRGEIIANAFASVFLQSA